MKPKCLMQRKIFFQCGFKSYTCFVLDHYDSSDPQLSLSSMPVTRLRNPLVPAPLVGWIPHRLGLWPATLYWHIPAAWGSDIPILR
ncbi:hypothetical protein SAMN05444581_12823 [Methylocapsa palsarum]|uniref:Uncharacterized protein n=1 Tax=Methylocapsa palsarum TaxID=1612308 RepID=A0A1I4CSU9_9HYPH|nr:hypothetical protein SAMN05444581_12823 [Methylocapsa palsarum]